MSDSDDRIEQAVWRTEIIRLPKQKLATFGTTNLHYYLLTEPVYAELTRDVNETVVREGRVIAEKPRIVTPYYLSHLRRTVADRLNAEIDKSGDPLAAIVKGEDELWDVSLFKLIYEVARGALPHHVSQMGARGLLNMDTSGVPVDARLRIEEMFSQVLKGNFDPDELKKELDRWNLFAEYEDRFFAIFKKK